MVFPHLSIYPRRTKESSQCIIQKRQKHHQACLVNSDFLLTFKLQTIAIWMGKVTAHQFQYPSKNTFNKSNYECYRCFVSHSFIFFTSSHMFENIYQGLTWSFFPPWPIAPHLGIFGHDSESFHSCLSSWTDHNCWVMTGMFFMFIRKLWL